MKLLHICLILFILLFTAHCSLSTVQAAPTYPLKKSANNRYFIDQNNVPFFINGDTPWSLIGQVSYEDAQYYIDDAASKGINSLIITLVESFYADRAPQNYYGVEPYTTRGKFTTPNEAYFAHADRVINYAASKGIQVILAPNYLGCCGDGYWDELSSQNSEADARWFGEWVGERYKNFPNLMYNWVNDTNPCGVNDTRQSCTMKTKLAAMAAGVQAKDPHHLHTIHPSPEYFPTDNFSTTTPFNGFTLDFNITYSYEWTKPIYEKNWDNYNYLPTTPFFLFESHYENDFDNATPFRVRRQAYLSVLAGAAGHHYGNNPIWHMNGRPGDNPYSESDPAHWKNHLNDTGRADLAHIRALFESRSWYDLEPDQYHDVMVSGYGSGMNYVGAASTSDQSTVIAYLPSSNIITVALSQVSSSQTKAWWFNPRTGTSQLIGTYPDSNRQFSSPDSADWVLVLDDASLNLPTPGTTISPTPPVSPTPVPGDLDSDGDVDFLDLVILITNFNTSGLGDLNLTGLVDIFDFNLLINHL